MSREDTGGERAAADAGAGLEAGPDGGADAGRGAGLDADHAPEAEDAASPVPPLARTILIYTGIRLGLLTLLTAVLVLIGRPFGMPLIVALAFAIVLQLPLSVVLFRKQRGQLTAALARAKSARTAERDRLFAELTGQDPPD